MAFSHKAHAAQSKIRAARKADKSNSLVNDPYMLGDEARHAGIALEANPFMVGTEEATDWMQGWMEAF